MNQDYRDLLAALIAKNVRFLVVGAHALAVHGYPRGTVDIDVWIEPTPENAARVWNALSDFGAPLGDLGISQADFIRPDVVAQFGLAPNRIDMLTGVSGLTFAAAWARRVEAQVEGVAAPVLGRDDLVENKKASGRVKDLADLRGLEGRR